MTILLWIVGVIMYLSVGSIVYGLISDNDPDIETRAIFVIVWPAALCLFIVIWLVTAFDVYTNIVAGIVASFKKRIMGQFRKEE